jgi:hypothetical protein
MPRPKTKDELLKASQENFSKLMELVHSYSDEEVHREFPIGSMNRNIRDILAHLHEWHLMMLGWYEVGMSGEKPDMPAKGYTWAALPKLNRKIWEDYQNTKLEDAKTSLYESDKKVQALIQKHSDSELFEKKRYKWTGSTSLGAYLISNTSSHYDWAIKRIKKFMR